MRISTVGDIAGQITEAHLGADTVTVASVCLPTGGLDSIRRLIPSGTPKWKNATDQDVSKLIDITTRESLSISAASVRKDSIVWKNFWSDAHEAHSKVASIAGGSISFLKAANLIKYVLFGQATTFAFAHAIATQSIPKVLFKRPPLKIREHLIIDNEIQGEESRSAFIEMWRATNAHQPLTNSCGIERSVEKLQLTNEQSEPLLLLADYVAGVIQTTNSTVNVLSKSAVSRAVASLAAHNLRVHKKFIEFDNPMSMEYIDIYPDFKRFIGRYASQQS